MVGTVLTRLHPPCNRSYLNVIASPLKSALAISPTWRPDNSSTAPFCQHDRARPAANGKARARRDRALRSISDFQNFT
jgi:hypothetical protein